MSKKSLKGQVVGKSQKSISVLTQRVKRHPKYLKTMKVHSRILAHDEKQEAQIGDQVVIVEGKPVSKCKSWNLQEIIK